MMWQVSVSRHSGRLKCWEGNMIRRKCIDAHSIYRCVCVHMHKSWYYVLKTKKKMPCYRWCRCLDVLKTRFAKQQIKRINTSVETRKGIWPQNTTLHQQVLFNPYHYGRSKHRYDDEETMMLKKRRWSISNKIFGFTFCFNENKSLVNYLLSISKWGKP